MIRMGHYYYAECDLSRDLSRDLLVSHSAHNLHILSGKWHCMYVCICIRLYVCVYMHTSVRMCVYAYVCTYVCICIRLYVCMYMHTSVCIYVASAHVCTWHLSFDVLGLFRCTRSLLMCDTYVCVCDTYLCLCDTYVLLSFSLFLSLPLSPLPVQV